MGLNPGRMRYRLTLYRRSGASSEDAHGRETKAWSAVASNVPCEFTVTSGRLGAGPEGRSVEIAAEIRFRDLEAITVQAGDGVVVSDSELPGSAYIVHRAGPDRKLQHYRSALLLATHEAIP